jgi:hypothetical protein
MRLKYIVVLSILGVLSGCTQVPFIVENRIDNIKDLGEDNKYELMGLKAEVEKSIQIY